MPSGSPPNSTPTWPSHVDTYECEWKATLDDPERLAHFVEFVNAPDVQTSPVWITERGQRVPA